MLDDIIIKFMIKYVYLDFLVYFLLINTTVDDIFCGHCFCGFL